MSGKEMRWLWGMRIVSMGILTTLIFVVSYNGGISELFDPKNLERFFLFDDFSHFAFKTMVTAVLCIIMLCSGILGVVMKTPRLSVWFAWGLLINAVAAAGCNYYSHGLNPGFTLWNMKHEIVTIILAISQMVCLYKLKSIKQHKERNV